MDEERDDRGDAATNEGHCLCGAVRFAFDGEASWRSHCHCESCRRQTASPFTTFFGIPDGRWRWTGETPAAHASSPGVTRRFCRRCGTPVSFESERCPGEIHFYAALLVDHAGFEPECHDFWGERVSWVEPCDELPRKGG